MAYLIVLTVSLLVGLGVYAATIRAGRERPVAVGFEGSRPPASEIEGPGAGYTYLRVGTRGPSWQDRIQGFVGLVVLVVVGAAALAAGIYQLGHLINVTIERFLQS